MTKYFYATERDEAKRKEDEAQQEREEAHRVKEWIRREVIQVALRDSFESLVKSRRREDEEGFSDVSERLHLEEAVKKLIEIRPEFTEEMPLRKGVGRKREQHLGRNPRMEIWSQEWSVELIINTKLQLSIVGMKLTKVLIQICVIGGSYGERDKLKTWILKQSFKENHGVFYVLDYLVNYKGEELAESITEEDRTPTGKEPLFGQVTQLVKDFHSLVLSVREHEDVCKTRRDVSKLESHMREVETLIRLSMKLPEKQYADFWVTMRLTKMFGSSFWSFLDRANELKYDDVIISLLFQIEFF